MISRIEARRYRCFRHLDISLPPCVVLAGANGTGKSTLLDIPLYIGDMLTHGVRRATLETLREGERPRAQSPMEILHRGLEGGLSLSLEATLPASIAAHLASVAAKARMPPPIRLRYELGLQLQTVQTETSLVVDTEYLDLLPGESPSLGQPRPEAPKALGWRTIIERHSKEDPRVQAEYRQGRLPAVPLSPDRLALSLISDEGLFPGARWFCGLLAATAIYAPDSDTLRRAQAPMPTGLRTDAANLPWQVRQLQAADAERFAEWVGMVRLALPNLAAIQAVEREEDRHAYLKLTYAFEDAPDARYSVTSSGLSDGTLRILALSLLPYLPQLPPLLTVEQPEDGIHPRAIDVIMESLSGLPLTQVLVTTHSPVVLSRTPLEQVVCLRRDEDGAAEALNGTAHPRLQAWRQDLDLGTLFAAGVLS